MCIGTGPGERKELAIKLSRWPVATGLRLQFSMEFYGGFYVLNIINFADTISRENDGVLCDENFNTIKLI